MTSHKVISGCFLKLRIPKVMNGLLLEMLNIKDNWGVPCCEKHPRGSIPSPADSVSIRRFF